MDRLLLLAVALVTVLTAAIGLQEDRDQGLALTHAGAPLHWTHDDLPLMVVVHPTAAEWLPDFLIAAAHWNARLGCDAITVSHDLHQEALAFATNAPGVLPVFGFGVDCVDVGPQGCNPRTAIRAEETTGEMVAAPILVPVFLASTAPEPIRGRLWWVAVHELGHAMGLEHDVQGEKPWSIMEPGLDIVSNDTMPPITAHDLEILRAAYCK